MESYGVAAGLGSVAVSAALWASLWYRLGKLENKIQLIYDNIDIVVKWVNNSKKRRRKE